ncbi:MAG: hypothetical protein ACI835_005524, partial [Planctomycetota bacterium]
MSPRFLVPVCASFVLAGSIQAEPNSALMAATAEPSSTLSPRYYWGDFDNDGLSDVFLIVNDGRSYLLKNAGAGRFEDATALAGLPGTTQADEAFWADFNGDSRLDLFLTSFAGQTQMLLQDEYGSFQDASLQSGIPSDVNPVFTNLIDFDQDGLVDLHIASLRDDALFHNLGGAVFERVELGVTRTSAFESALISEDIDLQQARLMLGLAANSAGGFSQGGTQGMINPNNIGTIGGGAASAAASTACAIGVDDMSNPGNCISASTVPALGSLLPNSADLFVHPVTRRVGIGTTSPISDLAVEGYIHATGGIVFPDFSIQTSASNIGPAGPAGPTGADGAAGPAGPTGAAGAAGSDGADGAAGAAGNDGAAGATGADGAAGPAGPTGAAGAAGNDGAAGATGADGAAGPAGPTGAAGAAGNDGAAGATGADGAAGPAGAAGNDGAAGATGADGAAGPAGPTGAAGAAGNDGAAGAAGPAGPTGAAGAAGNDGTDGAAGAAGPAGPTGAAGAAGNDGT